MPVPQQHECNPDDPTEAFVWALVGLPAGKKNVPLMVHPDTLGQWSEHLHKAGFRHHPELQQIEWHKPHRGADHWLNGTGRWVEAGTPRPPEVTAPDITLLAHSERAHLVDQLHAAGNLNHLLAAAAEQARQDVATVGDASATAPAPVDGEGERR